MEANIREKYTSAIADLGFARIGMLKDLDQVPTKNGGKLCLGLECLDRDLWDFDRAFPVIKNIGVHRVRIQSGWQKTEQTEGVYDFAWLDHVVDSLLEAGMEPFLCFSYGNKLYCEEPERCPNLEIGGLGHIPVKYERERIGWQNYIRANVEHFRDRITHYEIFNEPDVSVFCCLDMPWTEVYMELVKMTSPIIRELQPEAKIISCTGRFDVTKLLIDMGLGEYVDIHSFHEYSFIPETTSWQEKRNKLTHMKTKAPNLEFWRGEAGCPSYNPPTSYGALHEVKATEDKQAKFMLRHLHGDLECEMIKCSSYFHAYDFMHFSGMHRYRYGVIRHEDLSKKPSYHCLQVLVHLFDGETKPYRECELSYVGKAKHELTNEQLMMMRFSAFEKEDKVFFSYYLPVDIEDDTVAYKIQLAMPYMGEKLKNPVILDPMTQCIYPVMGTDVFWAPVTDYPMYVVDRSMIESFADIDGESVLEDTEKLVVEQRFEG